MSDDLTLMLAISGFKRPVAQKSTILNLFHDEMKCPADVFVTVWVICSSPTAHSTHSHDAFQWEYVPGAYDGRFLSIYDGDGGPNREGFSKSVYRPHPQLDSGAFHGHGGTPIAGWFVRGHSIKMDDDCGYPYFRRPPYSDLWLWFILVYQTRLRWEQLHDPPDHHVVLFEHTQIPDVIVWYTNFWTSPSHVIA